MFCRCAPGYVRANGLCRPQGICACDVAGATGISCDTNGQCDCKVCEKYATCGCLSPIEQFIVQSCTPSAEIFPAQRAGVVNFKPNILGGNVSSISFRMKTYQALNLVLMRVPQVIYSQNEGFYCSYITGIITFHFS